MDIDSDGNLSWGEARGLFKVRFSDVRDGDGRLPTSRVPARPQRRAGRSRRGKSPGSGLI